MKWTGLNEIRESYLQFFQSKQHLRAKSAPLVPQNDNSLLLINAGMAPLKPYFTGQEVPPSKRMTTCQKCIRTGDIENVGKTSRHATMFEMLGNFSFGDYFKTDAIKWAWEYITEVLEIPEDRLYVSVYEEDEEAAEIWRKEIGLTNDRIFYMGKEDNFWEVGIQGPCGPCSEIYYDRGEKYGCGEESCTVGCECDRYIEFWNLVFTQFERHEDGTYTPLEQKNIDTGMGLERIAAMLQDVDSIFDVDTIKSIRDHVCDLANTKYGEFDHKDFSIRVITDHIKSVTFLATDGVIPSNGGRGYVMRRLLRRAVRHGKLLGIDGLFLHKLINTVVDNYKVEYNELEEKIEYITKIITIEEEKFNQTIDRGMSILNARIDLIRSGIKKILDGEDIFTLADTYGFPIDLTREIAEEQGIICDLDGFKNAMKKQREMARAARGDSKYMGSDETPFHKIESENITEFCGFEKLTADAEIAYIVKDELEEIISEGEQGSIVTLLTPFYAESGGQAGDVGTIKTETGVAEVVDTQKVVGGRVAHMVTVVSGEIRVNQKAILEVDKEARLATMRNHSCAHLLQAALREVLGAHVYQAGQLVDAQRLRFDFSHFNALTVDEIKQVEKRVNDNILSAIEISVSEMSVDDAKALGAMALFGEKYGETVRVVNMKDASIELCGGTHVDNTATIGLFKIISETSVAAGVRRIEAVTGTGVLNYIEHNDEIINSATAAIKAPTINDLVSKCTSTVCEIKALEKEVERLNQIIAGAKIENVLESAVERGGLKIVSGVFKDVKPDVLRSMCDKVRDKSTNSVAVLIAVNGETGTISVACGKDAVAKKAHSGKIAQKIAEITGGKGGGRPDSAMAGVKDISLVDKAISSVVDVVSEVAQI